MKTREEILATGKYQWMDHQFDSRRGLARVKSQEGLWGIVNTEGEEVFGCKFQEIWKFIDRDLNYTNASLPDGKKVRLYLEEGGCCDREQDVYHHRSYGRPRRTYEEFVGSYAQDVAGFSDEDICDAFDGDPEAYWNID